MKNNNAKSALIVCLILLSATCFLYVNTSSFEPNKNIVVDISVKSEQREALKDAKMPDLKLVKTTLEIVRKFLTAK